MIDTDLKAFESDLNEVLNMFPDSENVKVKHAFKQGDGKVVNTVTVNGSVFAYGNLLGKNLSEIEEKRLKKRYAKLSVYKALSKKLDIELPWGALTGIRPTKLAYKQLEDTGEFANFFQETMKVTKEKTLLTQAVLDNQKGIYSKEKDLTDFFVFIPFCPSRCKYCSFITADVKSVQKHVEKYVDTLIDEINHSKQFIKKLRSIYIGGGTPVALSDQLLDKVLNVIDSINSGVEYTVEAGRPDRITESNLEILKKHGVTRICINPQTFNDKTLKLLGRNHTGSEVVEKYELAKSKFDINMDLIAGLPGENLEDFKCSLDKAIELHPENITVHTLCVKKGSFLAEEVKRLPPGDVEKMMEYTHKRLSESGYKPYYLYRQKYMAGNFENVGYALDGKACVYNIDVMEEIASTVANGANAISKRFFSSEDRIERSASPKDVLTYIEKIEQIKSEKEKLFR